MDYRSSELETESGSRVKLLDSSWLGSEERSLALKDTAVVEEIDVPSLPIPWHSSFFFCFSNPLPHWFNFISYRVIVDDIDDCVCYLQDDFSDLSRYQSTWWMQFTLCLWRAFMAVSRNKFATLMRVINQSINTFPIPSSFFSSSPKYLT